MGVVAPGEGALGAARRGARPTTQSDDVHSSCMSLCDAAARRRGRIAIELGGPPRAARAAAPPVWRQLGTGAGLISADEVYLNSITTVGEISRIKATRSLVRASHVTLGLHMTRRVMLAVEPRCISDT